MSSAWHLSVREVAGVREESRAAGPLAGLGQRVHEQLRLARMDRPGWQAERFVRTERQVRGQEVVVSGRIDGLWTDDDGTLVVEEYKSLAAGIGTLGPGSLPPSYLEAVLWQCRLYEHLLALELGSGVRVRGQVVFADPWAGEHFQLDVSYEPERCEAFLVGRLEKLVGDRLALLELASRRRQWAGRIRLPFARARRYQQEVMEDVAGAVAQGMNLALSAPTGIGKTVAALVPAVRTALAQGFRVAFATAKVSQQELALDTLERILPEDTDLLAVQIEAKERSCPREEILCLPDHCPLLRNSTRLGLRRLAAAQLAGQGVVRAQDVAQVAGTHGVCPFQLTLELAYRADVLVGDVNYLLHPGVRLAELRDRDEAAPEPRPWVAILDEAHALYERARAFLSPELDEHVLAELESACEAGQSELFLGLAEAFRRLRGLLASWDPPGDEPVTSEQVVDLPRGVWEEAFVALEPLVWEYAGFVHRGGRRPTGLLPRRQEGSRRVTDPLLDFWFAFRVFAEAAENPGPGRVAVLERRPSGRVLRILCLDPSWYLRERFSEFASVVAMSATLEPLPVYVEALGLDGRPCVQAAYPSPFPRENRLLVADVSPATRYRRRAESMGLVAERLAGLALLRPGNHLAFLPSYRYLEELLPHLLRAGAGRKFSLLPVRSAAQAPEVLGLLRRRAEGRILDSLLVCAVLGGSLSEGVDLRGDMAHTVAVVSPGLPQVSFERNLVAAYFEERTGWGFERAYLAVGLTAVVQAAGRLIRSEEDVGVVALLGERFGEPRYLSLLPASWQEDLVVTEDCVAEAARFWQRHGWPVEG